MVVDLGCGRGGTLQAAERAAPDAAWVGVDRDAAALSAGGRVLAHGGRLIAAELSRPLPLADGTVDAVVCHNVLECLVDPVGLLDDAARMLRPGGRAVWSHTDFDALVIHAGEPELTRRVVYAYADTPQPWMDASDGQMGRKLAGLVRRSRLQLDRCMPTT